MNIFQKKINKQSKLFREFHCLFWKGEDNISFYKARCWIRLWNKEEFSNTIDGINHEIKLIKIGIKDLRRKNDANRNI